MLRHLSVHWVRACQWTLVVIVLASASLRATNAADSAEASELRLKNSVEYLASDGLEGRGVGTKGIDLAADYLAAEFAGLGLKTDLFDGTPFQKFKITTGAELGPAENNRLVLIGPASSAGGQPQRIELELGKSFSTLAVGGTGKFEAPLVFVGYGITANDLTEGVTHDRNQSTPPPVKTDKDLKEAVTYDEYDGIDVKGKIVVMLRKEPQQELKESVFNGIQPSRHAFFTTKISNAFEHGAAAVIMVNDSLEVRQRAGEEKKAFDEMVDRLVEARRKFKEISQPADADRQRHAAEVGQLAEQIAFLSKRQSSGADPLLPFNGAGEESGHRQFPVVFCRRETIDGIVKSALGKDLDVIEKGIDSDLKPRSAPLIGWSAKGQTDVLRKEAEIKNVMAVLEGEGPLADETIVIGAHYDHLGMGGPGSLAPWTMAIHNGADDNASGTATLLEIAHRLATSEKKPRHRIAFIAFSGEERGLLGSAYYVRQPRFPLEKTIAMYNLDMVGRLRDDKLTVFGTATASNFDPLVGGLCKELGFLLIKFDGAMGRDQLSSDHVSFYSHKIPALHFFTGTHPDYHRPSDDADKLNVQGMRRIADLVVKIVEATDAADARPQYVEVKQSEAVAHSGGGTRGASLGTLPDYGAQVEGVALAGVRPGGPADKAGVAAGDVLIRLGDSRIGNIDDFMSALLKHKPGDKVKLVVKRDGKDVELEATLSSSGGR